MPEALIGEAEPMEIVSPEAKVDEAEIEASISDYISETDDAESPAGPANDKEVEIKGDESN